MTQLVKPYYNSGRNVTCDNFFTSISLAETLYANGLTLLGTMRKGRKEIPREFLSLQRPLHSTVFGYKKPSLMLSYKAKLSKCVILLTTMHRSKEVQAAFANKPEAILDYNTLKCPVDILDQMANTYTTRRKVRRWPMTIFGNILDMAAINAFVTWIKRHPEWAVGQKTSRRRLFLKDMAIDLLQPMIDQRVVENPRGAMQPAVKKARLSCSSSQDQQATVLADTSFERSRGRCHLCSTNRRIFSQCDVCHKHVCGNHSKTVCNNCEM